MKFYAVALLLLVGGLCAGAAMERRGIAKHKKSLGGNVNSILKGLFTMDFKSLLGPFNLGMSLQDLEKLKNSLLGNSGIQGELLNGAVKVTDLISALICTLKSVGLNVVSQLLSMIVNSLQLFALNKVCNLDKGLFNLITSKLNTLSQPALGDILCLVHNNISSTISVVGIQNIESFVAGVCSNGSVAALLEHYARSFTPTLVQMLKETVGLAGVDVNGILNLLASTGLKDVNDLRALLLKLKCLLKMIPLEAVSELIKSFTDALLSKLAPTLCASVTLEEFALSLLTGDNWLKTRALIFVGGSINVVVLQQLICLAKRFGVKEALGMDVTIVYKLFCNDGKPMFTLFDDVKRNCYKDLNTNCMKHLHSAVTMNKCKACATGGGCAGLKGFLPSAVVTKCNSHCLTCKSG